ncbi:MAG: NAD(+) synthase [Bacteroidales bacterium]|nr:NAD(+) synthase [Bacteroidales bacterium]
MNNEDYGFVRAAALMPRVWVADPEKNADEIIRMAGEAAGKRPSVVAFPELCVTGYTCADLFGQKTLLDAAEKAVGRIAQETAAQAAAAPGGAAKAPLIAIGAPVRFANRLYNCAILLKAGKILGIVPKTYLPNSAEFYEMRWFETAALLGPGLHGIEFAGQKTMLGVKQLFSIGKATVAVEICQDLWVPVPPSSYAALAGADIIVNLSASNETTAKHDYRRMLVQSTSARLNAGYVYCSCGFGESTQDLVWGASSLIGENGTILAENTRFPIEESAIFGDIDVEKMKSVRAKNPNFYDLYHAQECWPCADAGECSETDFRKDFFRKVEAHPFVPKGRELDERCREIFSIQVMGLVTRLQHIGCKTAVLGISGGLDSTLALLVTVMAFDKLGWDRSRIIGVSMPGFGTTVRTKGNARTLMEKLGVTSREISIVGASTQHLDDIGHSLDNHDATYENAQARERTQILMDLAGQEGGIVVGTGDVSELALGWCTYNGDHMSMYGVNASIPKTLVRTLVKWTAGEHFADAHDVLEDIVATPISPELVPAAEDGTILQVTEDIVGPYELHDFFLYNAVRWGYAPAKVLFLAGKAFSKEARKADPSIGKYDAETVRKWLDVFYKRFFSQQFKRSCLPDGPKVGSVSLSPRGDWRMPSDCRPDLWRKVLEEAEA